MHARLVVRVWAPRPPALCVLSPRVQGLNKPRSRPAGGCNSASRRESGMEDGQTVGQGKQAPMQEDCQGVLSR